MAQYNSEAILVTISRIVKAIRSWVADRLGIHSESARDGDWWEIDLIVVILFGSAVAGWLAWTKL